MAERGRIECRGVASIMEKQLPGERLQAYADAFFSIIATLMVRASCTQSSAVLR